MKNHVKRGHSALPCLVAAVSLGSAACSQSAPAGGGGEGTFDDSTGALVAHMKKIPEDVRCIEIQTSDWHASQVRVDVEPGTEATLRIAPLAPGYVSFWGTAYGVPCWDIWGDGGPASNETWNADYASAYVTAGQATPVTLTFRHLGSADVSVDFDTGTGCDGGLREDGGSICSAPPPYSFDAAVANR